jgi:hypothetical protein
MNSLAMTYWKFKSVKKVRLFWNKGIKYDAVLAL